MKQEISFGFSNHKINLDVCLNDVDQSNDTQTIRIPLDEQTALKRDKLECVFSLSIYESDNGPKSIDVYLEMKTVFNNRLIHSLQLKMDEGFLMSSHIGGTESLRIFGKNTELTKNVFMKDIQINQLLGDIVMQVYNALGDIENQMTDITKNSMNFFADKEIEAEERREARYQQMCENHPKLTQSEVNELLKRLDSGNEVQFTIVLASSLKAQTCTLQKSDEKYIKNGRKHIDRINAVNLVKGARKSV